MLLSLMMALAGCGASSPPEGEGKPSLGVEELREKNFAELRSRMVEEQLAGRGIRDERVLAAMRKVRRHRFMPPDVRAQAYDDNAVAIGFGQTISQPYVVAFMTEALGLGPRDRVLEIGTGSGYQAAVLAEIVKEVYTVEIICELGERAKAALQAEGYKNVTVRCHDGYIGWPEHAPFDAIIVTAAPPEVPKALVEQLKPGGRMIVPVGVGTQDLRILTKHADGSVTSKDILPVRFVPMVKGKP